MAESTFALKLYAPNPTGKENLIHQMSEHRCAMNAFHRVHHVKTDHDRWCDAQLLIASNSVGINGLIDIISDNDATFNKAKWVHRIGELAVQRAFSCEVASQHVATVGCRALMSSSQLPNRSELRNEVAIRGNNWLPRCRLALQAVSVHQLSHHPMHGAMWTLLTEFGDLSRVWAMHEQCAGFLRERDYHIWLDSCHGVGHGLSWWVPGGVFSPALSLGEAFAVCEKSVLQSLKYDHRCIAACTDGILHESLEAQIFADWASDAHPLKRGRSVTDSVFAVCEGLERNAYFCYHWAGKEVTFDGCAATAGSGRASITNIAGCYAAASAPKQPTTKRTLQRPSQSQALVMGAAGEALVKCAQLHKESYSFYIACTYGPAHNGAHAIFDDLGYAPWFRPEVLEKFVIPSCAAHNDSLAKVICESEVYDGFSGAALLNDVEFLETFQHVPPGPELLSDPVRHAIWHRVWMRFHLHMMSLRNMAKIPHIPLRLNDTWDSLV